MIPQDAKVNDFRRAEIDTRRAIEDHCGLIVQDANVILRGNCPNIDLVIFAYDAPVYVQVNSSTRPAGRDCVVVDGSTWTQSQLDGGPIFNKHDHYKVKFVIIVDQQSTGEKAFYVVPPAELEALLRPRANDFAARPKRDGTRRSIAFRKELPKNLLAPWRNAWHLLR
jgi:hypothetical protein